ncbi:RNA-directed DNA polymerase, eukaryota [Artemisia annua]|uniref:RNA-directed DNA polymerase, eukaryota n=1 Tax=Artemisia annua TaxID=35608 RepID=A0A2U1MR70_ARTAN|nr:RNA-directed DNA polymerase, eukaryota [Artemisia annua]
MGSRRKTIPVDIQARITKFFVSNLPDGCSGADLAKEVRVYGTIFDIYLARKRDKAGNRFAFVSLLDVKDRGEMEKLLSSIRLGVYKLKFNVARFVLEDGEVNARKSSNDRIHTNRPPQKSNFRPKPVNESGCVGMDNGMSFKDAFSGAAVGKTVSIDDNISAFEECYGKAILVKVASLEVLGKIRIILKEMGLSEGEIRCLGGFYVLISFKNKAHAIMARDELFGRPEQFVYAAIWEGQEVPVERIAWLRVVGIPLCILDDRVLHSIGSFFGTVVKQAFLGRAEVDSSFHFIGVLVRQGGFINDELFLKWRQKTFKVWITEESKEWLTEFVEDCGSPFLSRDNGADRNSSPENGTESSPRKGSNGDADFSGSGGNFGNEINDSVLETPGNVGNEINDLMIGFKLDSYWA